MTNLISVLISILMIIMISVSVGIFVNELVTIQGLHKQLEVANKQLVSREQVIDLCVHNAELPQNNTLQYYLLHKE